MTQDRTIVGIAELDEQGRIICKDTRPGFQGVTYIFAQEEEPIRIPDGQMLVTPENCIPAINPGVWEAAGRSMYHRIGEEEKARQTLADGLPEGQKYPPVGEFSDIPMSLYPAVMENRVNPIEEINP